jgi:hypothetical protein
VHRVVIAIGLVVGGCACATEAHVDPTPPPAPRTSAPNPRAFRFPAFLSGAPDRLYVDLGPIFTGGAHTLSREMLVFEADRYGADALVFETEPLRKVYASSAGIWLPLPTDPLMGLVLLPIALVGAAASGKLFKRKPEEPGYYRAIRYLDADSIRKIILDPIDLEIPDDIWRYLDNTNDIRDQFARLNALYAEGRIEPSLYERVRLRLCRS